MDNKFANKKCFVIMPFGAKKEKRPDGTEIEIDFDYVYHELIKVAVEFSALTVTGAMKLLTQVRFTQKCFTASSKQMCQLWMSHS